MKKQTLTQTQVQNHVNKGRKLEGKELADHLKAFTDMEEAINNLYKKDKK